MDILDVSGNVNLFINNFLYIYFEKDIEYMDNFYVFIYFLTDENAICQPRKKHLDLDGCGECICNPHGYGSICEEISCSEVHKRPISNKIFPTI